jgi:hypothetical protein
VYEDSHADFCVFYTSKDTTEDIRSNRNYSKRPQKLKTLHDWSKAPPAAVAACRYAVGGRTEWLAYKRPCKNDLLDYEERPEPAETCEEQEAWDALETARRELLEQRKREAHYKASDHPQKSHAVQMVGSALDTQEGGGHYRGMAIQPVEYITKNGLGFAEGCVIKYVSRHRKKNGAEDLRKAIHFLQLLIEIEYGNA